MKNKNYLSDQIRNNIPKRNIEEGRESVRMFVEMLKKRKINVIDEAILNRAYEEEDYVDEKMLGLVLKAEPVQYIPRYIRNMNAFHANGTKVVVVDELLEYTLISFLFTMYSLENNRSEENVTRCMKNFYVLEDLQNGKREIGTHNETQLYEMSLLPENLMHTAMDNYWTIWTFLIGHELYHAIHPEDRNGKDTELRAELQKEFPGWETKLITKSKKWGENGSSASIKANITVNPDGGISVSYGPDKFAEYMSNSGS